MTNPVSRPPENTLQRAIVARLRGSAALVAKLAKVPGTTPPAPAVVDKPREGQPFPYVRVGDHFSTPDNDLTSYGRQVSETIHVWTDADSMGPGQDIVDLIVGLLDHQPAALTALMSSAGQRCVSIRYEYGQALDDPDPEIRHHVVRFRVITAQEG